MKPPRLWAGAVLDRGLQRPHTGRRGSASSVALGLPKRRETVTLTLQISFFIKGKFVFHIFFFAFNGSFLFWFPLARIEKTQHHFCFAILILSNHRRCNSYLSILAETCHRSAHQVIGNNHAFIS